VLLFIYKDAIQKVKFLRGRDHQFYDDILPMLKPIRVKKGDVVIKQGSRALEWFIVIEGKVINMLSKRSFGEGSIFGITDIIYKRKRLENIIADSDWSMLMFERANFEKLLADFPDIDAEVRMLAQSRDELIQAVLKDKEQKEEAKK